MVSVQFTVAPSYLLLVLDRNTSAGTLCLNGINGVTVQVPHGVAR